MYDTVRRFVRAGVIALIVSIPLLAFAQAVAAIPEGIQRQGTVNDILSTLIQAVALPLITAVGGLVVAWINARRKSAEATASTDARAAVEARLLGLVDLVGSKLWVEIETDLRTALADGRVSADEREQLEEKIEAALTGFLTPAGLKEVTSVLGIPAAVAFLLNFLTQRIFQTKRLAAKAVLAGEQHQVPQAALYRPYEQEPKPEGQDIGAIEGQSLEEMDQNTGA